jgi:hypothetical protein
MNGQVTVSEHKYELTLNLGKKLISPSTYKKQLSTLTLHLIRPQRINRFMNSPFVRLFRMPLWEPKFRVLPMDRLAQERLIL